MTMAAAAGDGEAADKMLRGHQQAARLAPAKDSDSDDDDPPPQPPSSIQVVWGRPEAQIFAVLVLQLALPPQVPWVLSALGIPAGGGGGGLLPQQLVLGVLQWEMGYRICRQVLQMRGVQQFLLPGDDSSITKK
jgi:hypothetical protein